MSRLGTGSAFGALLLFFTACGTGGIDTEPLATATFDTISGVVVVTNGPRGQWREEDRWYLREAFRIGKVDDAGSNYTFRTALLSPVFGPNNQILVQDFAGDEVSVYDSLGQFVRRMGRSGQGPGDLNRPTAVAWDGADRIWVTDPFNRRYSLFDTTGSFVRTIRRPWQGTLLRAYPLRFDDRGSVIDQVIGVATRGVQLIRFDPANESADSLTFLEKPPLSRSLSGPIFTRDRRNILLVSSRYTERLLWVVAPDYTVWSTLKGTLRLIQRDLVTGDTIRIVETSHRRPELDASDQDLIRLGLGDIGVDPGDADLIRPIVEGLHVLDDGHILVRVIDDVEAGSRAFDVFDPRGVFLGTVAADFRIAPFATISSRGRDILVVTTDDLDVPYVIRASFVTPGS